MNKSALWGVIAALLFVVAVLAWILFAPSTANAPITDSQTPTSIGSDNEPLHTRVKITTPLPGATVGRSFIVAGEAPGNWYFEASFPVQVHDKDGNVLASVPAQAQSDWMTTSLVPFEAVVTITENYTGPAVLVLLRDNPSGLPENDDALEVPIVIR